MKLYKVTAKSYSLNEYKSFIVWANNEDEARDIAYDAAEFFTANNFENANVELVKEPNHPQVVLSSFNASY